MVHTRTALKRNSGRMDGWAARRRAGVVNDRYAILKRPTRKWCIARRPILPPSMPKLVGTMDTLMESAFAIVLFVVVGVAAVAAVIALATSRGSYDQIGRGGLSIGEDRPAAAPTGPAAAAEREAEIRQMLEARNARRAARGEAPEDVDAQLQALSTPAVDPELRDEVRTLVEATNARRVARGQEPLDVEAEIDRRLREL
jgi:hypothetical protein